MVYKLYSVYDDVSKEYGPLFQAKNDDVAVRNFVQMFVSMHTDIVNVSSFHLMYCGCFNNERGTVVQQSGACEIPIDSTVFDGIFDAYDEFKKNVNVSRETKEEN